MLTVAMRTEEQWTFHGIEITFKDRLSDDQLLSDTELPCVAEHVSIIV